MGEPANEVNGARSGGRECAEGEADQRKQREERPCGCGDVGPTGTGGCATVVAIQHRSKQGQADLIGVRVRAELVELRTSAVNAVRGFVKSFGQRMPKCDAGVMNRSHAKEVDEAIRGEMELVLEVAEKLNGVIAKADGELKKENAERYEKETADMVN